MYALVEIAGKQYKAVVGEKVLVDHLNLESGSTYETEKVLAIVDGENAKFGSPYIADAKVTGTVGEMVKGDKVKVYKFHRRKGYRRTQGHREQYTELTFVAIEG